MKGAHRRRRKGRGLLAGGAMAMLAGAVVAAILLAQGGRHQSPRRAITTGGERGAAGAVTPATALPATPPPTTAPLATAPPTTAPPTAAAAPGTTTAATPPPASRLTDRRVLMLGDSLTVGSAPTLTADLTAAGFVMTLVAQGNLSAYAGVLYLGAQAAQLPGIVVVALGSNDGNLPGPFKAKVEQALASAGPSRCVVWVNIVRPGGWDGLDTVLADEAQAHPNLHLVDWRAMVALHPEWLARDGVHASPDGYAQRSVAITAAVTACASGI